MNGSFLLRDAILADAEIIVRHRRSMFEEMGYSDAAKNDEMDRQTLARLRRALPTGDYRGWLVENDAEEVIAGAGLSVVTLLGKPFNPAGTYGYLMSLYVEPAYRRRSIARRLMRAMIEWSEREGLSEVKLHASLAGRSLYTELGFKQTNEMRLALGSQAVLPSSLPRGASKTI